MSIEREGPEINQSSSENNPDENEEELVPSGVLTSSDPGQAAEWLITRKELREREAGKLNNILENNTQPDAKKVKKKMIMLLDRIDRTPDELDKLLVSLAKELSNVTKSELSEDDLEVHQAPLLNDVLRGDVSGASQGLYGKAMESLKEMSSRIIECDGSTLKMSYKYGLETEEGSSVRDKMKKKVETYLKNILGVSRGSNIEVDQDDFNMDRMEAVDVQGTTNPRLNGKVAEVLSDSYEYDEDVVAHYRSDFLPQQEGKRQALINEATASLKKGDNEQYAEKMRQADKLERSSRIEGIPLQSDIPSIVRSARVKVYKLRK